MSIGLPEGFITAVRRTSRRVRSNRRLTRTLFGADVDRGVHDDLWDVTTLTLRKALRQYVKDGDRVLDLGTGHVGILSIFVSKLRKVDVVAVDVSTAFVENARRVAAASGASRVAFVQSDWFSNVEGPFDVVFCNLPYLPTAAGIAANATTEHRQIWDGGDDGLAHARTILERAPRFLSPRGRLFLGLNTLYVPRDRTERLIAANAPAVHLERIVRSLISPSEVYVIAPAIKEQVSPQT